MPIKQLDQKVVLVTGAASGIGRSTALAFADRGSRLVLCDVNREELDRVADRCRGQVDIVETTDVSDREQVRRLADRVHGELGAVDVLVNNAGVGLSGKFLETSLEDWEWVLNINLWGVIHGCHYFVPKMVERGAGGHVVNVASAAGYFASEAMSAYATSKYAVVGVSEALRDELAPKGIGVSTICPGIIRTSITRTMRMVGARSSEGDRHRIDGMYERRNYGPERVASAIVDSVRKGRDVVPVTPEAWVLFALKRAAPTWTPRLLRRVTSRIASE